MREELENEPAPVSCASCGVVKQKLGNTSCLSGDATSPPRPGHCPTTNHADVIGRAAELLAGDGEEARLARVAAKVEGLCYERASASGNVRARWTRVEDTIAFAKLMGWRKIGIATCIGLLEETAALAAILEAQGLEPLSVCCKTGSVDKASLGIPEEDKIKPGGFEAACNPVAQAEICNLLGTDMNVVVGLCVGHDMLFGRHSKAPVTTLVVKDRVTGHNPAAVLYGGHYYRRLRKDPVLAEDGSSERPG